MPLKSKCGAPRARGDWEHLQASVTPMWTDGLFEFHCLTYRLVAAGSGGEPEDCVMLASEINANICSVFTFPTIFGKLCSPSPLRAAKSLASKNCHFAETYGPLVLFAGFPQWDLHPFLPRTRLVLFITAMIWVVCKSPCWSHFPSLAEFWSLDNRGSPWVSELLNGCIALFCAGMLSWALRTWR